MTALGWSEIIPVNTDQLDTPTQSRCIYPFTNSIPWNPIEKRICIVGADHGEPDTYVDYLEEFNTFVRLGGGAGSHEYQHLAVNPFTGERYLLWLNGSAAGIYKYHPGVGFRFESVPPEPISQYIAEAIVWWKGAIAGGGAQGALILFTGNFGIIHVYNPLTGTWTTHADMTPGSPLGLYQMESAYSAMHNCMVYGGGHAFTPDAAINKLFRLNADCTKTAMPDAPHAVGIYNGMNMVSDSRSGNIMFLGFGEHWSLNPSGAGTWTKLPTPPTVMDPAAAGSVASCDTPYGVVYLERVMAKPRSTMRVWRS